MAPSTQSSRQPVDWEALARYVTGESPADEGATVRAWLRAHPGDAALLAALDRTVERAVGREGWTPGLAPADVDRALRRLTARRDAPAPRVRAIGSAPSARRRVPWRVAIPLATAASLAVFAGGAMIRRPASGAEPARAAAARGAPPALALATAVGRRDSLRLPDGTRVVLGPDSRLAVAAGFGAARREVALRGTAYFDVAHDDARPFTVRAGGAVVRDVGTAFTVRAEDGGGARVAVTEGTVELGTPGDAGAELLLHRGDVGAVDALGRLDARRGGVTADELAWTEGRLVFRDAPLDDVRDALRHWYGLELRVDDRALAGRRLTASFDGEPVDRVLQVIGLALGARLERRGGVATAEATR